MGTNTSWKILLLAAALAANSCVPLDDLKIPQGAVSPEQRTVMIVYVGPGPTYSEDDSKIESATKILPGLGLVMESAQHSRELKSSKDLQQYLPSWRPELRFWNMMNSELQSALYPGKITDYKTAQIPDDVLHRLNSAADIIDWRSLYFYPPPEHSLPRNYSVFLSLDDALILEINLMNGVVKDEEGNVTPVLNAATKLFKANTMRTLWWSESSVRDDTATRNVYDFKVRPQDIIFTWERLLEPLAKDIALKFTAGIAEAGISLRQPSVPDAMIAVDSSTATMDGSATLDLAQTPKQAGANPSLTPEVSTPTAASNPTEQPPAANP